MQQRTLFLRKIVSLQDLVLPLSKSSIFQKIDPTPQHAYKVSNIFQYTQTQNRKQFSIIKTQLTKYYRYRLIYLILLLQACGVNSGQANFIILNNLMKLIYEEKNTKLLTVPGLENYGYLTKRQVQKSIYECLHKIKQLNSAYAIINVINSDETLRYDISFIMAIYHLANKEGSLQALITKIGVNHSLITLNTIQINQHIIKFNEKVDIIDFRIQRNNFFQAKTRTITSIQTNSFLDEISFEIINNDMYMLKHPYNFQLFEKKYKNQSLTESESNYIKYCSGNPQTSFPIQFCNMDQYSQRQQVSILNLQSSLQISEDKFCNLQQEQNKFTDYQFESIPHCQNNSIFQNGPRVNRSFRFVKAVNEIYVPHQMTIKYRQKSKNYSLKKQTSMQNTVKNHSMDEKDSLLTTNEDTRKSTLLEMRQLINLNVKAFDKQKLKLQRLQRRDHLQNFKKNSIKQRNINDAAECRRKLLQEYLKRTNQKL